jgi:hypothetical protein
MGSEVGAFIIVRNLEVFGGQSYKFGYNFLASDCLSWYVPSCSPQTCINLIHAMFQIEILGPHSH